jgi:hypothetical protein
LALASSLALIAFSATITIFCFNESTGSIKEWFAEWVTEDALKAV